VAGKTGSTITAHASTLAQPVLARACRAVAGSQQAPEPAAQGAARTPALRRQAPQVVVEAAQRAHRRAVVQLCLHGNAAQILVSKIAFLRQ